MARLPVPGSDQGEWGTILNEYLSQAHDIEGDLKAGSVTNETVAPGANIAQSKVQGLTASLNAKVGTSGGVTNIWSGTQAAYNAIGTKNPTTLYVITEG